MNVSIYIDGERFNVAKGLLTGITLYQLTNTDPRQQYLLLERPDDRDIPIRSDDLIIIDGKERFSVASGPYPPDDDPILRKAVSVVLNENLLPNDSALHHSKLTVQEIAALDPHFEPGDGVFIEMQDVPDAQVTEGMRVIVQPDDRFYTAPAGNVGYDSRLETHVAQLRQLHSVVDLQMNEGRSFVIIRNVPIPAHWNRNQTDLLLIVAQGYPLSALDMFWVSPGLRLASGQLPQNADQIESYAGCSWQRFSWHYPPGYQ